MVINTGTLIGETFLSEGVDSFAFTSALSSANVDRILDFNAVDDFVQLENAVFVGLANGLLAASAFRVLGVDASTAAHRILYNPDIGALYYDADGSGASAPVLFAVVAPETPLNSNSFFVT